MPNPTTSNNNYFSAKHYDRITLDAWLDKQLLTTDYGRDAIRGLFFLSPYVFLLYLYNELFLWICNSSLLSSNITFAIATIFLDRILCIDW